MASCKGCLSYGICNKHWLGTGNMPNVCSEVFLCEHFKDRTRFVELPCKVGDTVYQTDGIRIYENKIERIIFDTNNIGFDETSIGKSIFLTREEAEQALKEREKC